MTSHVAYDKELMVEIPAWLLHELTWIAKRAQGGYESTITLLSRCYQSADYETFDVAMLDWNGRVFTVRKDLDNSQPVG